MNWGKPKSFCNHLVVSCCAHWPRHRAGPGRHGQGGGGVRGRDVNPAGRDFLVPWMNPDVNFNLFMESKTKENCSATANSFTSWRCCLCPPIFITNVEPELSQQAFHPIAVLIIMTVTFSMSWNVGKIFISGLGIIEILDCWSLRD